MTSSTSRLLLVVLFVLSAVALGTPQAALAQAAAQPSIAEQVENPPADAQKSESGLVYKVINPGTGAIKPTDDHLVKLSSTFWAKDTPADKPMTFGSPAQLMMMSRLTLPGLHEALTLMSPGQKMRVWIPEKLAFNGTSKKVKGTVMADLVLLQVVAVPTPPQELMAPPADAQKTKSGLAWKVLKPGTGTVHPKATSSVTVHYSGWTTTGKMFDSSVLRGQPATFSLEEVIQGWTEGMQLMVAGEKRCFWIPGRLAYDDSQKMDTPKGMLIFEIELLAVDGK
jgi:FKBP-type peptidyl-prolyl cis-trans isomerase